MSEKQPTYGRPRLLTHEEILEGAIKTGLEGLTMKRLAAALNVGTATLYQYFPSRKDLMRAAAVHALSDTPLPKDNGEHWSVLAREYARAIQALMADNPSFLEGYQRTDYGFEVEFKLAEGFLQAMGDRKFSARDAMRLFNMVGMASFAGAIETLRQREFEFEDENMETVALRQFGRVDKSELPHVAEALDVFVYSPDQKVDDILEAAFKTIARERGEVETNITIQS